MGCGRSKLSHEERAPPPPVKKPTPPPPSPAKVPTPSPDPTPSPEPEPEPEEDLPDEVKQSSVSNSQDGDHKPSTYNGNVERVSRKSRMAGTHYSTPIFKLGTHKLDDGNYCSTIIFSESLGPGKQMLASFLELPIGTANSQEDFDNRCDELDMPNTKTYFKSYNAVVAPRKLLHLLRLESQYGVCIYFSDLTNDALTFERYLAVCGPSAEMCEMACNNLMRQMPYCVQLRIKTSGNMVGQMFAPGAGEPEYQTWLANDDQKAAYTRQYRAILSGTSSEAVRKLRHVHNCGKKGEGSSTIQSALQPNLLH